MEIAESYEITTRSGSVYIVSRTGDGRWWLSGDNVDSPTSKSLGGGRWQIEPAAPWPPVLGDSMMFRPPRSLRVNDPRRMPGGGKRTSMVVRVELLATEGGEEPMTPLQAFRAANLAVPPRDFRASDSSESIMLAADLGLAYSTQRRPILLNDLDAQLTAGATDYFEFVVQAELLMYEEREIPEIELSWGMAISRGEADHDLRIKAFSTGFSMGMEDTRESIKTRRSILAAHLGADVESVRITYLGPYGDLFVFTWEEDMYVVFLPQEDVLISRQYVADNLGQFIERADLFDHTALPNGAEAVLETIRSLPPELATESLRAVLADEDLFVDVCVAEDLGSIAMMTAGLATDGALFELEGGVRILRILDMDDTMVEFTDPDTA
jgi:hypothetical protein